MKRKNGLVAYLLVVLMVFSSVGVLPVAGREVVLHTYDICTSPVQFAEYPATETTTPAPPALEPLTTDEISHAASGIVMPAPGTVPTHTGAFEDGDGIAGAQWRLYGCGTLVVDEGFVQGDEWRFSWFSPWHSYRRNIYGIVFTGTITAGAYMQSFFRDLEFVQTIEGLSYFDTSNVTDMGSMFWNASSLTSLDLSGWDTRNVTRMDSMFRNASSLTNLDVSGWNTSSVTHMDRMFEHASELTRNRSKIT